MAYRFNNGNGAVTCEECCVIIDEILSYQEYKERYTEKEDEYCMECKKKLKLKPFNKGKK